MDAPLGDRLAAHHEVSQYWEREALSMQPPIISLARKASNVSHSLMRLKASA